MPARRLSLAGSLPALMRRAALALTVLVTLGLGGPSLVPARAWASAPNPSENITLRALPSECSTTPLAAGCENALVQELDRARAALGLGPYLLPAGFAALSPDRQLLILTDLDRVAYGLAPVPGLNAQLSSSAAEGARGDYDPLPAGELSPGGAVEGFASNWAGGFANVLEAYFEWMYDDGYPGANRDCASAGAPGCWGHRQNVLASLSSEAGGSLSLGAAAGADGEGQAGYTLLIALTPQASDYYYSWAEAQTAGAGREEAQPSLPSVALETPQTPLPAGGGLVPAGCSEECPETLDSEAPTRSPTVAGGAHSAQIAASIAGQLVPPPQATTVTALLRRGSCPIRFKSLTAGVVSIRWYGTPRDVGDAAARPAQRLLLAAGRVRFAGPRRLTVEVALTRLGRRALARRAALRLTALGTFTPAGSEPVSAARSFTLAR
jgi:hypothetical protein